MVRRSAAVLTDREAQIMQVLWDKGTATAEEVRESLADRPHDSIRSSRDCDEQHVSPVSNRANGYCTPRPPARPTVAEKYRSLFLFVCGAAIVFDR